MTTEYRQRTTVAEVVCLWRDKPVTRMPARSAVVGLKIAGAVMAVPDSVTRLAEVEVRFQGDLVAHYVSDHGKVWRIVPVGPS